jgi:hypothetical protein
MAHSTAVYLYCVARSVRRPVLRRAPDGVPGASAAQAVAAGRGLWIVVADVPLDQYGPGRLEPRLQDFDWVATVAVAHEAVIEFVSRRAAVTVIPAKLFTMFSSILKATDDIVRRRKTIDRVMKHVAGCQEWGLRVTRRPLAAAAASHGSAPASGAAFLAARKAARDAASTARAAAIVATERAFAALARHARDAKTRARAPEPGTNPPILEAAFLVTAGARPRFKAEARRQVSACAAAGADLVITGPWPAYNFVGEPA